MNLWMISGNLGHDPKSGTSQSGTPLCYMDVAVSVNSGKDTAWVSVTAFGKTAENCLKYLKKGAPVMCYGTAGVRQWTRNDGAPACGLTMAADRVEFGRSSAPAQESAPDPAEASAAPVPVDE